MNKELLKLGTRIVSCVCILNVANSLLKMRIVQNLINLGFRLYIIVSAYNLSDGFTNHVFREDIKDEESELEKLIKTKYPEEPTEENLEDIVNDIRESLMK